MRNIVCVSQIAGLRAALEARPWLAAVPWEALLDGSAPAPMAPPEALDESDADTMLIALTARCQQGFE